MKTARSHSAFGILERSAFGILAFGIALTACGKKGPPLAPLRLAPMPPTDMTAKRVGNEVTLRFTLPEPAAGDATRTGLARVEVFALSVAKAADAPTAPDFLREGERVGSVVLKPDQTAASFVETLGAASLELYTPKQTPAKTTPPEAVPAAPPPVSGGTTTAASGATAAASGGTPAAGTTPAPTTAQAAPAKPVPVRVYMVVPVTRRGQRGASASASVPLVDPPSAPGAPLASYGENAVDLTWVASEEASYNIYEISGEQTAIPAAPLNNGPLAKPSFTDARVEFGKTRCYRVTAVRAVSGMRVESDPSPQACVTPADTFPPPAPAGLAAVAGPGSISLIWDAVAATDLAGYVVLRGNAPGDTLQALTPEPIKENTYRDAAVQPGSRYVYAVVAVDASKNVSAQSTRVEETAR